MSRRGKSQRGGFVVGLVAGLLLGLALALGVALYVTKAPVPFINKVPQRTAEQDNAEAERNRNWDPNAPLAGRVRPPAASAAAVPGAGPAPDTGAPGAARDPAAILSGAPVAPGTTPATGPAAAPATAPATAPLSTARGPEPFVYFVQAGAFTRSEDAEQQRARLAMLGQTARITEREQAGRTVYRVRLGPFPTRDEADALQTSLQGQSIQAQIVRVERN
ncbi:MAG: SPOR domain-containing protein [Rubrivivax sp.]|nr:SPOR domain-containing protein [Rubrivivax sp.]